MRACCCRAFLDLGALRFPGLRTCLRLWASPLPRQTRLPRVFKCTCCSRTRARNSLAPRSLHVARVWRALPHRRHHFLRFGGMSVSLPMLEPQNKTSEHDHVAELQMCTQDEEAISGETELLNSFRFLSLDTTGTTTGN